ncbi:Hint domain-containing protein [Jannaschia sp. Os4]|uniref:peroxidase family protein n=1 Tax=Jannaschia sp. Os4 TaxID=2807617 RepID=UPI0019396DB8|nr:peroxidase family protein [Jannaschia sp. Os4]MBM2577019.1 Hint domain-containing protein [Jannaschia sp. Os4]
MTSDPTESAAARCPFLAQLSEMPRLTEARYADGVSEMHEGADPLEVARTLFDQDGPTEAASGASALFTTWGQFLDHDLSLTPDGEDVMFAGAFGDHDVTRSEAMEGSGGTGPLQFGNAISWQIDGSMVYGSNEGREADLRAFEGGRLRMDEDPNSMFGLLPTATPDVVMAGDTEGEDAVFLAGDVRANENPNLLSLHTLMAREHNHWAERLAEAHPDWDDEQLFQGARQIVEFQIQKITYEEWLPLLVGNAVGDPEGLAHDPDAVGEVALEFSTAAFRFGHTMVADHLLRVGDAGADTGSLSLMDAFFDPSHVREGGIDDFLRGMAGQSAEELDTKVVDALNFFLATPEGVSGFSLPALNLMRAADHGIGSYVDVRAQLLGDIDPATLDPQDFSIITDDPALQAELAAAYDDVHQVDLWVGGLAEDHLPGSMAGPLFTHIIADQFVRTATADETFLALDPALGAEIIADARAGGLADVILRNTHVDHLQDDPFLMGARALVPMEDMAGDGRDDDVSLVSAQIDRVALGSGDDALSLTGGSQVGAVRMADGDDEVVQGSGSVRRIDTGDGDDTIRLSGTARADRIDGGGGDDSIGLSDLARSDRIDGGDGDDAITLDGRAAAGRIDGGRGDDSVSLGPDATADIVRLAQGDDTLSLEGPGLRQAVGGGGGTDVLQLSGDVVEVIPVNASGSNGIVRWADGSETRYVGFEEVRVAPCFAAGTRILAARGKRRVEDLRAGDLVMTLDRGLRPLAWVGRRVVAAQGALAPIRFETGVLGNVAPLVVSPQHRVLLRSAHAALLFGVEEVLAPAAALLDRPGVQRLEGGVVEYVHLLFDRHEIVLSDGAPTESFHPGATVLPAMEAAARDEVLALFPDLARPRPARRPARPLLSGREARLLAAT